MVSFNRMTGLAAASAGLAALAVAQTAWAQPLPQNNSPLPVTITVQVPPSPRGTATTLTVQVSTDLNTQHTDLKVTSDASPGAPAVLAASVRGASVAAVPVDSTNPF